MGLIEQLDYSIQLVAGLAIFKLPLRLIELKAHCFFHLWRLTPLPSRICDFMSGEYVKLLDS